MKIQHTTYFRISRRPILFCLFALVALLSIEPTGMSAEPKAADQPFVHPGVAHSKESFEFIKSKIKAGEQPWAGAWEKLRTSSSADLDWKPQPFARV